MIKKLIIGSRGSRLALIQAQSVVSALNKVIPGVEVIVKKVVTAGDRDRHSSLDRLGVGVFVKELEDSLLRGEIDLAVHSLKDVPTVIPEGLCLLVVMERLDPRDGLVAKAKLDQLPSGAKIGSASLRRTIQLKQLRPDFEAHSIRGNIDTRLKKVDSGEFDGVVVAVAALIRLGWEDRLTQYLPLEYFLPAVGQGALVIEGRSEDKEIAELVSSINHVPTWRCTNAERTFLYELGGGCRAPIACLATLHNNMIYMEGMVADVDSGRVLRAEQEGSVNSPEDIGRRLAARMQKMGATEFIDKARSV